MRAKYGTTFILTTHIVEDISIADRVLMLHKGRLVFDGAKERLEHMFGNKRVVEIRFVPDAKLNLDFGKDTFSKMNEMREKELMLKALVYNKYIV